jgi:hypothetical protein
MIKWTKPLYDLGTAAQAAGVAIAALSVELKKIRDAERILKQEAEESLKILILLPRSAEEIKQAKTTIGKALRLGT